jgi:hypothetical protein
LLWAIVIMSLHSLHWNVRSSGIPAKLGSGFMSRIGSRHIGHAGLSTSAALCDVVMSKGYAKHCRSTSAVYLPTTVVAREIEIRASICDYFAYKHRFKARVDDVQKLDLIEK